MYRDDRDGFLTPSEIIVQAIAEFQIRCGSAFKYDLGSGNHGPSPFQFPLTGKSRGFQISEPQGRGARARTHQRIATRFKNSGEKC